MVRLKHFIVAMLMFAATVALAAPPGGVPADGTLSFDIIRNGSRIGGHAYRFEARGNRIEVAIRTEIDYRFLFIPLYRFEHDSREVWENGRLTSLSSDTDEDGTPVKLRVSLDATSLQVIGKEGETRVDLETVPASLWNRRIVERDEVLGTVSGNIKKVKVEDLGEKIRTVRDETVRTHHFRLSGEYNRDLWYDADNILVHVRFEASDGSTIEYVLK